MFPMKAVKLATGQ